MDSKARLINQQLAGKIEGQNLSGTDFDRSVTIPDHQLLKCIGRGSYGTVWLATNMMGNYRAVKVVFRSSFQNEKPFERELAGIKRFEPISRSHEGFIDVLHVGINESEGYFYYVMELGDDIATGQSIDPEKYTQKTLSKEISLHGSLPVEACLQSGLTLSQALSELHKHGLVHRDVKPANIIFVNGVAKLADIGLVADAREAQSYVGTEGFIPPEGPGTPQADVFSLGKVLYEAVTGRDRQDFPELPTLVDELPDADRFLELNEVILHACKNDKSERYASAWDMHADLVVLANGKSVKRLKLLERRITVLKRVFGISGLVFLFLLAISYQGYREWKRVVENRERQVGANVAYGNRSMEAGDLLHALPYFAEALQLDEQGKKENVSDRLRFGAVLAQCPKLTHLWIGEKEVSASNVEFSPDGKRIVVSLDEKARVYELAGEMPVKTFGGETVFKSATFSPDGKFIVTASEDGYAKIWDANNLEELCGFHHPGKVFHARFSPDGAKLVTACQDGNARVWNWKTRELELLLKHGTNEVSFATFSHDGRLIVTTGHDFTARIWDASTGQPQGELLKHKSWVNHAAFSHDDSRLATASFDRTVRVWDVKTGRQISPDLHHLDGVGSVEFSPDDRVLLSASLDGAARLWRADSFELLGSNPIISHGERIMFASFGPDGHSIVTAGMDGTVRVWDLASSALPMPLPAVSLSKDGSRSLIITNDSFQICDTLSGEPISSAIINPGANVEKVELDADGHFVMSVTVIQKNRIRTNRLVQVFDVSTGQPIAPGLIFSNAFTGIAFSGAGKRLTIFEGSNAQLWDIMAGRPCSPVLRHEANISSAFFNPNGSLLMTISGSKVHLWKAQTGKVVFEALQHSIPVKYGEFSSDGAHIVTCCQDDWLTKCYAQVWSVATGLPVGPQLKHGDGVLSASFSPDGRRVVTASEDFTASEWDFSTGRKIIPDLHHQDQVQRGVVSPNGKWILTASSDKTARLWGAQTGDPMTPLLRHLARLTKGRFLGDSFHIITTDSRGRNWLWQLPNKSMPTGDLKELAQLLSGDTVTASPGSQDASVTQLDLWRRLRSKYPDLFETSARDVKAWYEFQLAESEAERNSFASSFHKRQLSLLPGSLP